MQLEVAPQGNSDPGVWLCLFACWHSHQDMFRFFPLPAHFDQWRSMANTLAKPYVVPSLESPCTLCQILICGFFGCLIWLLAQPAGSVNSPSCIVLVATLGLTLCHRVYAHFSVEARQSIWQQLKVLVGHYLSTPAKYLHNIHVHSLTFLPAKIVYYLVCLLHNKVVQHLYS